jgi:hypothetical protein
MKLDFFEIVGDAFGTLFGRIFATALAAHLGAGFGAFVGEKGADSFEQFLEFFIVGLPLVMIIPILFGFAVLFTRYEWNLKLLMVPLLLSVYLGWSVASWN